MSGQTRQEFPVNSAPERWRYCAAITRPDFQIRTSQLFLHGLPCRRTSCPWSCQKVRWRWILTSVQALAAQRQLTDTMTDDGSPSPCPGTRNKVDMATVAEYLLHWCSRIRIIGMRLRGMRGFTLLNLSVFKATVTVVDIDSGAEEKITVSSQGSAAGLNLKENQRIYFGGLPSIGNYR